MPSSKGAHSAGTDLLPGSQSKKTVGTSVRGQYGPAPEVRGILSARCVQGQRSYFAYHSLIWCQAVCSESTRTGRAEFESVFTRLSIHVLILYCSLPDHSQARGTGSHRGEQDTTDPCHRGHALWLAAPKDGFTSLGPCFVWVTW